MKEAAWAREGGERKRRSGSQVYGGEEGGGVDEVEGEGGGEGERGRQGCTQTEAEMRTNTSGGQHADIMPGVRQMWLT